MTTMTSNTRTVVPYTEVSGTSSCLFELQGLIIKRNVIKVVSILIYFFQVPNNLFLSDVVVVLIIFYSEIIMMLFK